MNPGKVNAVILIFGTNMVNTYKSSVFTKKENNPKLTRLSGIESKLRIGLQILNNNESKNPLNIKIGIPPSIFTP